MALFYVVDFICYMKKLIFKIILKLTQRKSNRLEGLTYSVNHLSWTHVLLNWPEETNNKSLKDKFKTKETEFNQFPVVLKRTWTSRSVSVNKYSIGSQVSQDGKFQFTFSQAKADF